MLRGSWRPVIQNLGSAAEFSTDLEEPCTSPSLLWVSISSSLHWGSYHRPYRHQRMEVRVTWDAVKLFRNAQALSKDRHCYYWDVKGAGYEGWQHFQGLSWCSERKLEIQCLLNSTFKVALFNNFTAGLWAVPGLFMFLCHSGHREGTHLQMANPHR